MADIAPTLAVPATKTAPLCGVVVVTMSGQDARTIPLPVPWRLNIGSADTADIKFKDANEFISPEHGCIKSQVDEEGRWHVTYQDLMSLNGSCIDYKKIPPGFEVPFENETVLTIGYEESLTIRFRAYIKDSLESLFDINKRIRTCQEVDIYEVVKRESQTRFEAKLCHSRSFNDSVDGVSALVREFTLQSHCKHWHVLQAFYKFQEPERTAIIIEFANHRDLRKYLTKPLSNMLSKSMIFQLLEGLKHIHSLNVIHRNLKPSNIFITNTQPMTIKIGDFGAAVSGETASGIFGRAEYTAPEVLAGGEYTAKIDVWSVGVIMFKMFTTSMPFPQTDLDLRENGTARRDMRDSSRINFPEGKGTLTAAGRTVIEGMLRKKASDRPTAEKACQQGWFRGASRLRVND